MPFRPPASWRVTASPNHNSRGTATVSAIVLHADAAAKVDSTLDWCRRSQAQLDLLWEETPMSKRPPSRYRAVSYHVVVGRNGLAGPSPRGRGRPRKGTVKALSLIHI